MENDILEVIECALAKAGYKVLDGNKNSIIIRDANSDTDYNIRVSEIPG
ncbi:MAG: hypothetical protein IJW45_08125 [Oscillospiraceae bacterium]|nr:hypothetical protein [Oscillospiraceae bacterium]